MTNIIKISIFAGTIAVAFGVFAFMPVVSDFVENTVIAPIAAFADTSGCGGCGPGDPGDGGGGDGGGYCDRNPQDPTCAPNPCLTFPHLPECKPVIELPECKFLNATPNKVPYGGGDVVLEWKTENGTSASINNGIGSVPLNGSKVVFVDKETVFVLTVKLVGGGNLFLGGGSTYQDTCQAKVTVEPPVDKVAKCDFLTANPTVLPIGGGNVTLEWGTTNAQSVSINNGIGSVSADGSKVVNVTDTTTFILTAVGTDNSDTCQKTVTVGTDSVLRCDYLRASDDNVRENERITLEWETTGATSASINNGIGSVPVDGDIDVIVEDDTTYILTITNGNSSASCRVSVDVSSGGGGGGSKTPRCDLDVSDDKVKAGEEITLSWDTTNAREITIEDGDGKEIFESDDSDYMDGEIDIIVYEDTEFVLIAERGSRDRKCRVEVEVEDTIKVFEKRDQPLVIALTEVPYTGFEAGPMLTTVFYSLLILWALFIAYWLVIRKDSILGFRLRTANDVVADTAALELKKKSGDAGRSPFAPTLESVNNLSELTTSEPVPDVPVNLPTAHGIPSYLDGTLVEEVSLDDADAELKTIEDRAHTKNVLLSSDAMRHFIATRPAEQDTITFLDRVIERARSQYPSEDGWVVLNLARMQQLCAEERSQKEAIIEIETELAATQVPVGAGSLAEAIVAGNVNAAYQMIERRPMVSLADAAADLDAVYRLKQGLPVHNHQVSELLKASVKELTLEDLKHMIEALTSAVDGTYTEERSAVKMAILKAVSIVTKD